MDRKRFFDAVRPQFGGKLTPKQVEGMTLILDEWQARKLRDVRWLAYMLATAQWETASTMQPINERGGNAYFKRMYDIEGERPKLARSMGNTTPGDGVKYRGRGFVQLTWKNNYLRAGREVGVDLVAEPDRAMEPAIAVKVLFSGMIEGWFTELAIGRYFNLTIDDPMNARRVINGTDKAKEITALHNGFLAAIKGAS